eukprot:3937433-Rhodomonas_salina.2
MPGTDLGYNTTRRDWHSAGVLSHSLRNVLSAWSVPAYALAMPCPVLTYAPATPCPVLRPRMVLRPGGGVRRNLLRTHRGPGEISPIVLRNVGTDVGCIPDGMSGTDVGCRPVPE